MFVRLVLHSFHLEPLRVRFALLFGADFRDLFELRGLRRAERGTHEEPRTEDGRLVLGYCGLDGVRRATTCEGAGAEARWEGSRAVLDLVFAPQEERAVDVVVSCESQEASQARCREYAAAEALREREHRLW